MKKFNQTVSSAGFASQCQRTAALACLTLALGTLWSHGQSCGPYPGILAGPITNTAAQHHYYLLEPSCWADAEARAVSLGGHLVTIDHAMEHDWVISNFSSFGGVPRRLWIGLHDPDPTENGEDWAARRAEFVWSSGRPVKFQAWPGGTPVLSPGSDGFVRMRSPDEPYIESPAEWVEANGSELLNAVVEVPLPIEIWDRSGPISAFVGGNARFHVSVESRYPVLFQWQRNRVDLPGATNATLFLTNVQPRDAGLYRAIVSSGSETMEQSQEVRLGVSDAIILSPVGPSGIPPGVTGVTTLAVGMLHGITLLNDGNVVTWGQITSLPWDLTHAIAVSAGSNFNVAVKPDGTVRAWSAWPGAGKNVPEGVSGVLTVEARGDHVLALRKDGKVIGWGENKLGECAIPSWLSDAIAIAAGDFHGLALRRNGSIVGWGYNAQGQATVPPDLDDAVAIAAGSGHSVALRANGTVIAWGDNSRGQTSIPAGLRDAVAVSAGPSHTLILKLDGTLEVMGQPQELAPPDLPKIHHIPAGGKLAILGNGTPQFTVQPWDKVGEAGKTVMIAAKVVGAQPMAYQWRLNGADITSATGDTLIVDEAGIYTLTASNHLGVTTSVPATLSFPAKENHAPVMKSLPDRTINAASHLEVKNSAADPDLPDDRLSYQLIEVPQGATVDLEGTIRWTPGPEYVPSETVFTTVVTDAGQPRLSATNSFKVSVLDTAHSGPVGIIAGPFVFSQSKHEYFLLDSSSWTDAEATAVAMGGHLVTVNSPEEHTWLRSTFSRFDGIDRALWIGLVDPDPSITWGSGADVFIEHFFWVSGQPITFFCWSTKDEMSYGVGRMKMAKWNPFYQYNQCEFAPEAAWVSLNGVVEVPLELEIRDHPSSTWVGIGRTATLRVVSDGPMPISYQWQFMGTNLPGETKQSLTISNAQPAHSGPYQVIVSDPFKTLVSETAYLSVAGIVGWGNSFLGALEAPVGAMSVVAITSGAFHSLALRDDGTVVAWGANHNGETNVPQNLQGVVSIAAGLSVSLALKADGRVIAWGADWDGVLNVPSELTNAVGVAAGATQCLAVRSDGTVVAWGKSADVPAGLTNVVSVATGGTHSMALRADGTIAAWGNHWTSNDGWIQATVPADLSNVVAIAAGDHHSLALQADGTVAAWGYGPYGEDKVPPGLTNVVAISAGHDHSLALKSDGTVVTWGLTIGDVSQPKDLPNVVAISAGTDFSLALLRDGAPHLTVQPWDRLVAEGKSPTFSAKAIAPQSMDYQWQFNEAPIPGATRDTHTITNAQPEDAGQYTLVVSNKFGKRSSRAATLVVARQNTAPVVAWPGNKTVSLGQTLSFTIEAADSDFPTQNLTYALGSGAPAAAQINPTTGLFTWTPTQAGGNAITVIVTDDGSQQLAASTSFEIIVLGPNTAPHIGDPQDQIAYVNTLLTFTVSATDPDQPPQTLTFTMANAPAGAQMTPQGVFTWTPTSAQGPSTSAVIVTVTDDGVPAQSDSRTFTLMVPPPNTAPVMEPLSDQIAYVNTLLTFTVSATDADQPPQTLTFTMANAPAGAQMTPQGVFTWTPASDQASSTNEITVTVNDDGVPQLSDSETFKVLVQAPTPVLQKAVSPAGPFADDDLAVVNEPQKTIKTPVGG